MKSCRLRSGSRIKPGRRKRRKRKRRRRSRRPQRRTRKKEAQKMSMAGKRAVKMKRRI
jgi:hypothetical protein